MSAEGKKKRGESGASNAKAIPFRYHAGAIFPKYMREIYAMAGLHRISPVIRNGQTGNV